MIVPIKREPPYDHSKLERNFIIGEVDLSEIFSEVAMEIDKRNPNFKVGGICRIEVFDREGNYPHFHVIKDGVINTCIRIDVPEYYEHGKHHGKLGKNAGIIIDNWLRKPNQKYFAGTKTNWESIVFQWLDFNPTAKLNNQIPSTQPDYTNLK